MSPNSDSANGPRPTIGARISFVLCAVCLAPHLIWVYGVEEEAFSRLYVLPITLVFLVLTQYFAMAGQNPLAWKRKKMALVVALLFILALPILAILTFVSVPLVFVASRLVSLALKRWRLPRALWRPSAQYAATALLVLVVFPAMNYMTLLIGPHRQFFPPVLAAHPLVGINEDGFRSPPVSLERSPDRARLLFLGDSSTFGFPYGYDDAFPFLATERLTGGALGEVEYINAAIIGSSLVQIASQLDRYLSYDPDCAILMVGYHHQNSVSAAKTLASDGPGEPNSAIKLHFHPPMMLPLLLISAAGSPLGMWISKRTGNEEPDGLPLFVETLDDVMDRLDTAGVCTVVLEYPSPKVPQAVHDALREAAESRGQTFVPLLHLFDRKEDYAMDDEVHPDLAHHRLIAEKVAEVLEQRLAARSPAEAREHTP